MTNREIPARSALVLAMVAAVFLSAAPVFASGFFIPEVGARAMGRGGATVVGGDDLTALYINPANLAQLEGTNVYMDVAWAEFHTYYRREPYLPSVHNMNPFDPVQFAAISSNFGLKGWTFAYGAYGPYGVTNRWPSTGPQRYNVIETNATEVYQSLGVGWKPIDYLRIGLDACLVNLGLENYYGFTVLKDRTPAFDTVARLDANTSYVPSWAAGVVITPVPHWFEVGFSYLPVFNVTVTGSLTATMPPLYGAILGLSNDVYKDKLSMPLHFPPLYRGGGRFMFGDLFDIEYDACYFPWTVLPYYDVHLQKQNVIKNFKYPLEWRNTWNHRLGTTVKIDEHWKVSAGYQHEDSATPQSIGGLETPRHIASGGFTVRYFGVDLDLSYAHVFQADVDVPPVTNSNSPLDDGRGRYKSSYDFFVSSFNINFERMYYAFNGKKPW
jgi:long-subunit fatty acid transport protein